MGLTKTPVNGMRDILPREMEIRDYVQQVVKDTYRSFGFTPIETPCMENIGNLSNKQGGENEKLIFKVLKRGEKLHVDTAKSEEEIVDYGMRYDLTVPLSRFYANNANNLPSPFKALQIGNVWRADRPQRGRYRQFMQCDIDIIGEPGNLAEIELILATTTTIGRLGFKNFEIHINDRRILKAMAAYSGFPEAEFDAVFIILDKMDKIGADGVAAELKEAGYAAEAVEKYLGLFKGVEQAEHIDKDNVCDGETIITGGDLQGTDDDCFVRRTEKDNNQNITETDANASSVFLVNDGQGKTDGPEAGLAYLVNTLGDFLDSAVSQNLREIIYSVNVAKPADFRLIFDPTLVRGMSYYTGTIFEIVMPELGTACGGGGRYDGMVGKFTGTDVPACGFSIGFERIILLLMERGFTIPSQPEKIAYLVEKGLSAGRLAQVIAIAQAKRSDGKQVLVVRMNKNKKFQKERLEADGYTEMLEFYRDE